MIKDHEGVKNAIRNIVAMIRLKNFNELVSKGFASVLEAQDIRDAVTTYGRTIIDLPDQAFDRAYEYDLGGHLFQTEIQFYTEDEGESDLTLICEISLTDKDNFLIKSVKAHVL